jgi:drug/metabolite transporter (DMT)-like permease
VATSRSRITGAAAAFIATVFWSFGGVFAKKSGMSGVSVTFARMWVATAAIVAIALVLRQLPSWTDMKRCAVNGVLFAANLAVFFTALEYVAVANALVVAALTPVLMLPIAVRTLGERVTMMKVVCAVTAVVGVVVSVLAAPDDNPGSTNVVLGMVLSVISVFLWIGYLVMSKQVRRTVDTVPFMCAVSIVGAIGITVYVLISRHSLSDIEAGGFGWIVLLALGPGLLGHGLVAWAQPRIDASVMTVVIQGEPVGAAIAAFYMLDEKVSAVQAVSMGAVIVALCVLVYAESREREAIAPDEPIAPAHAE